MIYIIYGTRPEYIKMLPLIEEMKDQGIDFTTIFIGQHDSKINTDFVYDKKIEVVEKFQNRSNNLIYACLKIQFNASDVVIVQGDTTTAFGAALSAKNQRCKVLHLEAGLRTYGSEPFPEENNRRMIDVLSDVCFCPTPGNEENIQTEKLNGITEVVGNTAIDSLIKKGYNNILVTIHRAENLKYLPELYTILDELAVDFSQLKFTVIQHPNSTIDTSFYPNLEFSEPLENEEFLEFLNFSIAYIGDSGGVIEEGVLLNKPMIILREKTEREEAFSKSFYKYHCKNPNELQNCFFSLMKRLFVFGEGFCSKRVVEYLKKEISEK